MEREDSDPGNNGHAIIHCASKTTLEDWSQFLTLYLDEASQLQ